MNNFSYQTKKQDYPKPYTAYSSGVYTISGTVYDYSIKDNTSFFSNLSSPYEVLLRNGAGDLIVKFNSDLNDPIKLSAYDFFSVTGLTVKYIFVTSSGVASDLSIFSMGWV